MDTHRIMKILTYFMGIGLWLACLTPSYAASLTGQNTEQAAAPLDRIVAVVNDGVITQTQLDQATRTVERQLRHQNTPLPPERDLQRQVLEHLVLKRLQLQLAKQLGIDVDGETLDRAVRSIARQNNMDLSQFRAALKKQGYNFVRFRKDVREQIIIGRLQQQQVNNRITVTNQEVDNFLANLKAQNQDNREYHIAHILIAVPEAASPEQIQAAHKKAEQVLAKLRAGADFAQTAVAYSDGQHALQGGDLGWRTLNQIPTLFAQALAHMQPGDVSGLLRSPSGFHIIKLVAEKGANLKHVVTQTQVRQILIRPNALLSDAQARARLEKLRREIENGASFAALARADSEDTFSAANGGSLGWVNPGQADPVFQQVMDKTPVGQVSEPFRTPSGWHILQVEARRQHDITQEYNRAMAEQIIRTRKTEEALELWLRRLRDEAYVRYRVKGLGLNSRS